MMSRSLLLNFTIEKYDCLQECRGFVIMLLTVVAMMISGCFKFHVHNGFYVDAKMRVFLMVGSL